MSWRKQAIGVLPKKIEPGPDVVGVRVDERHRNWQSQSDGVASIGLKHLLAVFRNVFVRQLFRLRDFAILRCLRCLAIDEIHRELRE